MEQESEVKKWNQRGSWWIFLAVGLIGLSISCWYRSSTKEIPRHDVGESFSCMGTVAMLDLCGKQAEEAKEAVHQAFNEVETHCNLFDESSELSRLNAEAAKNPFACSELMWNILTLAREAYQASGGAFDISSKPLMDLWGFYRKRGTLPTDEERMEALSKVGLDKVVFDDEQKTVFFSRAGMALDLGGIAKGVAVDLAAEAVKRAGVYSGVINLGGNMMLLPDPLPGRNFYRIGLRNPLQVNKVLPEALALCNVAVATSGGYERFVELEGKKYAHIMDPRTGKPVDSLLSSTVIAPTAGETDWMSTAVFVGGETMAKQLIQHYPGVRMILCIPDDKNSFRVVKLPDASAFDIVSAE